MATTPTYALGMDMFVPNDTIRDKPVWAALTRWVVGAAPEAGGIPLGIKGIAIGDNLPTAFTLGRKRAASTALGTSVALTYIDCSIVARGGTKRVIARREKWPETTLLWSRTLSNGHMLAQTPEGVLMHAKKGTPFKRVDLTGIGYAPNAAGVVDPYPEIISSVVASAANHEAYILGTIALPGTVPAPEVRLYRFKDGELTKVEYLVNGVEQNFSQYTIYPYDFHTGFGESILFRAWGVTNSLELFGAKGDVVKRVNWSANSLANGLRMFQPCAISSDAYLCVRYGLDRGGVSGNHTLSILTAIAGTVSTDLASLSIHGESFVRQPSITPVGNNAAIVVMPKVWRIGLQPDVGYNIGFTFNNPYSYYGDDAVIDGYTIYDKYQDVFVASQYAAVPLLSGVEYNRDVKVIPTGSGRALVFCARRANVGAPMRPEVHYFDGSFIFNITPPTADIYPDVTGFIFGDNKVMFCTGSIDDTSTPRWYACKNGELSAPFLDPFWTSDRQPFPMLLSGYYPGERTQDNYLVGQAGFISRQYADATGATVISTLLVAVAQRYEFLPLMADAKPQVMIQVTNITNGVILTTRDSTSDVSPRFYFFYLTTMSNDEIYLELIGSAPNKYSEYVPPPVIRVNAASAAMQMDSVWQGDTDVEDVPLGIYRVSSGKRTPGGTATERNFTVSKIPTPTGWVGDLAQVGENFILCKPSIVIDLRPGILASSGQL